MQFNLFREANRLFPISICTKESEFLYPVIYLYFKDKINHWLRKFLNQFSTDFSKFFDSSGFSVSVYIFKDIFISLKRTVTSIYLYGSIIIKFAG